MVREDSLQEVTIEEIIEEIRGGEATDILYEECSFPRPNIITIVCGNKFCNDVREIKPVISTHSPTQILIRSMDKDKIVTSWKEFFVHSTKIYVQFKINHMLNTIEVERKENELEKYDLEEQGKSLDMVR